MAPAVHHVFAGDHALGGERHSIEAVRAWFERLFRLFPSLEFSIHRMTSHGVPWNIWVAVEWSAKATPAAGDAYVNRGAHWINLRKGRVVYFHAYEDSQAVALACDRMAALGIAEAAAPPITD